MALIKCQECGKEVSDKSENCIHCGYGLKQHFEEIKKKEIEKKANEIEEKNRAIKLEQETQMINPPSSKPIMNGSILFGIFWMFLAIVMACLQSWGLALVEGFFAFVLLMGGYSKLQESRELFEKYSNNPDEYKKQLALDKIHIEELQKQMQENKQNKNNLQGQIKCPTCGSINVNRITTSTKVVNTAMFGLFGNKRKMQFQCDSCKYMW